MSVLRFNRGWCSRAMLVVAITAVLVTACGSAASNNVNCANPKVKTPDASCYAANATVDMARSFEPGKPAGVIHNLPDDGRLMAVYFGPNPEGGDSYYTMDPGYSQEITVEPDGSFVFQDGRPHLMRQPGINQSVAVSLMLVAVPKDSEAYATLSQPGREYEKMPTRATKIVGIKSF